MAKSRTDWRFIWNVIRPTRPLQWVLGPLVLLIVVAWFTVPWFVTSGSGSRATWDGGSLVVTAGDEKRCTIQPDNGEARTLEVVERVGFGTDTTLAARTEPWFSGSATVSCDDGADIHTGWNADVQWAQLSFGWWMLFALVVGALVVIYLVFLHRAPAAPVRGSRRSDTDLTR